MFVNHDIYLLVHYLKKVYGDNLNIGISAFLAKTKNCPRKEIGIELPRSHYLRNELTRDQLYYLTELTNRGIFK